MKRDPVAAARQEQLAKDEIWWSNTNIVELYSRLAKNKDQLTFYNSGIGTYAEPSWKSWDYWKQVGMNKLDLALALRFEKILLDAYRWLSEIYEDGDRIFLFGFSRGAYQVRALAGMIEKVGLIHKGNEAQIPFAYELYARSTDEQPPNQTQDNLKEYMPWRFKTTFSRTDVRVHFVGVWDTVSSVGLVRADKNLPLTTCGMHHVCYFRHALALDECRVKFLPEYTYGGVAKIAKPDPKVAKPVKNVATLDTNTQSEPQTKSPSGNTKEVWFVGTHSDIGGGNVMNTSLDLYGPALRWMIHESIIASISLTPLQPKLVTETQSDGDGMHDSMVWYCLPLEIFCIKRLSYKGSKETTWWPHLGASRQVADGQLIHTSAYNKQGHRGHIKAHFPTAWGVAESEKPSDDKLEKDLFDKFLENLDPVAATTKVDNKILDHLHALVEICSSPQGLNSLQERADAAKSYATSLYSAISKIPDILESEGRNFNLEAILLILGILLKFPLGALSKKALNEMPSVITKLRESAADRVLAEQFLRAFSTGQLLCIQSPTSVEIHSVAFSPDGKHIASGSFDHNIHIWDLKTGEELQVFRGHTERVLSVAYSPDGKHIVSGSGDKTICIWNSETGEELRVLRGHAQSVISVACSPDGKYIVSGSKDKTIRIWDSEMGGEEKVLRGHTNWVQSVACSLDGKKIVSGSYDQTICIWNLETGEELHVLQGHTHLVLSVAFSPDGNRIVSGSADCTVRIWDAGTGKEVGAPLEGPTDLVWSVAYSPAGKHIASGSHDGTVRLWSAETRELLCVFEGHTDSVLSVAFSPDGKQIASGSDDRTIRLWDVEMGRVR
ncbi:quinon protein alcohol dehydrogenase-like superfamily [Rhodocollybia butyracea]|uniref:Quinon protein alcohol dehydrogenase-like superfamily n=1 Tax=Rhodocollybia butyracea TaxID=206335 RepID=A0A9P5TYT7_9AGAR|nr:quinon protein alcohol dehydrogenase-like superfamily [Rhodocollybia butyracea]